MRKQLDADIDFLQTEASLYAATGDTTHAVQYMNRVQAYYAKLKQLPPPNIDDSERLAALQHRATTARSIRP